MTVSRIQNQTSFASSTGSPLKSRQPQGLGQTPDRLEDRRTASQDNPPSVFKEFLFKPAFIAIKFIIRGIFIFFDFLRKVAFEEKDREVFLNCLNSLPRPETLLIQFSELYSVTEQNCVYRAIGKAHPLKTAWKEAIWERTPNENLALGRRLVQQNPFLLRDHLSQ